MAIPDKCTNCHKYVDSVTSTSTLATRNDTESEEIRIWDVVAYVYRIGSSFGDFKAHFTKENHQQNLLIDGFTEDSLRMCDLCISLVSDTYKSLKKFENLTHQASFILKIQYTDKRKWENFTDTNVSNIPVPLSSSAGKNGNENLFNSFNFDVDHQTDEPENCFYSECKYEINDADTLLNNEGPFEQVSTSKQEVDFSSELPATKNSLESRKQLVVKIEKISDEDLEYYRENKRFGKRSCTNKIEQQNRRKIRPVQKKSITDSDSERRHCTKQHAKRKIRSKLFTKRNKGQTHLTTEQDRTCKLCGKLYTQVRILRRHMKFVHQQASKEELEKYYKTCEICGKTKNRNSLKVHMETHRLRETFKCEKCHKEYLNKSAYEEHLLTHSDNFSPYLCRHCGMTFNDKGTFTCHERRHTEEKKFSCEICSNKYFVKAELEKHIAIHYEERKFVCDECGMSYKGKSDLLKHKRIHKDVAENGEYSSKCQYCGRLFKHSRRLKQHLKIHEKAYECSFCGKILSKSSVLKAHENLHKNNPDYQPRKNKTFKSDAPYKSRTTKEANN